MRPLSRLAVAAVLLAALVVPSAPARAADPKCPLPLHECLERYSHMRERPWFGAWLEVVDSTSDVRRIERVFPGSPAERAGLKPGDRLKTIGGQPPRTFFAGKAGWKPGEQTALGIERDGRAIEAKWTFAPIPDDVLAELLGAHVVGSHMAYGDFGVDGEADHAH